MAGVVPGVTGAGVDAPARLEFIRLKVPLVRTHRSAHTVESTRNATLVVWTDPTGASAVAECDALSEAGYVTETADQAWASLTEVLGPGLVTGEAELLALVTPPIGAPHAGGSALDGIGLVGFGHVGFGPAALAAASDAALGVQLRLRGSNLSSYLNGVFGRPGAEIATWSAVVSAIGADGGNRGSEEITAEVESALRSGATLVKLKVNEHTDIAAAAALVREVSRRVRGDEVDVAADANRSLPIDRAEAIERADLTYIEEPLLSGVGLDALRKFRSQSSTPVALDESISDVAALELALQAGAVDRVSVKPARLGGTARTAALAMAAEAAGVGWFVGGMFELGVGRATALCLAAQSGLPTDLGPNWRYVERDICAPVDSAPEGNLVVPQWAPLGVESLQLEDPAWIVDRVVLHS